MITENDGNSYEDFVQFRHFQELLRPGFSVFLTCKQLMLNFFRGQVRLTFEPLVKILWCGQLNESSLAVIGYSAICFFNVFEKLSKEDFLFFFLNDFEMNQFWQWRGLIREYIANIFKTASSFWTQQRKEVPVTQFNSFVCTLMDHTSNDHLQRLYNSLFK